MRRRDFLPAAAGLAAAASLPAADGFTFVHMTDPHIQPELRAAVGCDMAFAAIAKLKPEFVLAGGDLVFDVLATGPARAKQLFDLYQNTAKQIGAPIHSVPGNHDVYGLFTESGVLASDPMYGKKMFEDRIGKRYGSFDHKGWHFVLLDSIFMTPERKYQGRIDDEQLDWLKGNLAAAGPKRPVIVLTHIPLVSSVMQIVPDQWADPSTYMVVNSKAVLSIMAPYNVKAVLQGHTHIRENVQYQFSTAPGAGPCQFITSGAVCGNWWKGSRLGHPEGFAILRVKGDAVSWQYQTYGFVAEQQKAG